MQLLRDLFWLDLAATAAMTYRGFRQWRAYNEARISRTQMVNAAWVPLGLGATTAVFLVLSLL